MAVQSPGVPPTSLMSPLILLTMLLHHTPLVDRAESLMQVLMTDSQQPKQENEVALYLRREISNIAQ